MQTGRQRGHGGRRPELVEGAHGGRADELSPHPTLVVHMAKQRKPGQRLAQALKRLVKVVEATPW